MAAAPKIFYISFGSSRAEGIEAVTKIKTFLNSETWNSDRMQISCMVENDIPTIIISGATGSEVVDFAGIFLDEAERKNNDQDNIILSASLVTNNVAKIISHDSCTNENGIFVAYLYTEIVP